MLTTDEPYALQLQLELQRGTCGVMLPRHFRLRIKEVCRGRGRQAEVEGRKARGRGTGSAIRINKESNKSK